MPGLETMGANAGLGCIMKEPYVFRVLWMFHAVMKLLCVTPLMLVSAPGPAPLVP